MSKYLANAVTGSRILLSLLLLLPEVGSPPFLILYLTAGFTDMIDGTIARKTGSAGSIGAKLDTIADIVFTAVCLIRILPTITIPPWILVCTGLVAVIKAINVISGFVMLHRFVSVHTVMNKITGALLFLLPLLLPVIGIDLSAPVVLASAAFAAIQEGHYIRTGRVS